MGWDGQGLGGVVEWKGGKVERKGGKGVNGEWGGVKLGGGNSGTVDR
jgi:hypothetical protein